MLVGLILTAACVPKVPPSAAEPWLQSRAGTPAADLSGSWRIADWGGSTGFAGLPGWGAAPFTPLHLDADGGNLAGAWGRYQVLGAADAADVHLIASFEDTIRYTFFLQLAEDGSALAGKICDRYLEAANDECVSFRATRAVAAPSGGAERTSP
jgi:hypothetical protein